MKANILKIESDKKFAVVLSDEEGKVTNFWTYSKVSDAIAKIFTITNSNQIEKPTYKEIVEYSKL